MVHYYGVLETAAPMVLEAIACLQRLSHAFQERRLELAAAVGLSEPQWEVLEQISTEHFMPSLFARQRESSAAAVSKILRQLLDRKLVTAHVDRGDGRHRRYRLTPTGQDTLARLRAERTLAISRIWHDLDPIELGQFTRFGNLLTERLENYSRELCKKV